MNIQREDAQNGSDPPQYRTRIYIAYSAALSFPSLSGRNWRAAGREELHVTRTALFVRWVLGVGAAVFLAIGFAAMFLPGMVIRTVGLEAGSELAMADVRAVYGGLDLAIGILLAYCFVRKHLANGLAISALVCTCLFSGRLVGIIVDPARDFLTYGLFAVEVLGAVLSAVAWFLARQPEVTVTPVAASPAVAAPESAPAPTTSQEG